MRRLIRLSKSKAAWEEAIANAPDATTQLMKAEFRKFDGTWDLRISVYESDGTDVVRLVSEHVASFLQPFKKAKPIVDAHDAGGSVETTPGSTNFVLSNERHRELVLTNESALRELAQTLVKQFTQRAVNVEADEVLAYIAGADDEWAEAARINAKVAAWMKVAARKSDSPA